MKKETSSNLGCIISFTSFMLSSEFIFSPLHKSGNIIISAISAFCVGFPCLLVILHFFREERSKEKTNTGFFAFTAIVVSALATVISLMLLTEIIRDVAYVANKNVSMFYYISLSLATLTASYYLCFNSEKGIYRFCILSGIFFLPVFIMIFSAFTTTKSLIIDIGGGSIKSLSDSILRGALTGLFFTTDACAYITCFNNYIRDENRILKSRQLKKGYIISLILIASYNITTVLIFGSKLTAKIQDPDYALVKLLPGIDLTETISALRIISFLIKSSVYIFATSKMLMAAFGKMGTRFNYFILIHYILIPVIVIFLTILNKNLEYGAFQHMIYPSVILFSIIIAITNLFFPKKE